MQDDLELQVKRTILALTGGTDFVEGDDEEAEAYFASLKHRQSGPRPEEIEHTTADLISQILSKQNQKDPLSRPHLQKGTMHRLRIHKLSAAEKPDFGHKAPKK